MLKVSSVWVRRDEGRASECVARFFCSFSEANAWLVQQATTVNGVYDKCRFVVTYEDGHQYEGRFDLEQKHQFGASLQKHMVDYLTFCMGARQPSNITKDQYERFISARGDKRKECAEFLNTRELFSS